MKRATPIANGQTADLDAHFCVRTTWDTYGNVFGGNWTIGEQLATTPLRFPPVPPWRGGR